MSAGAPSRYLGADDVVDSGHPRVRALFHSLISDGDSDVAFARQAFEYVRDEIGHSYDVGDPRVTISASDVVEHGVGLCYAKTHLFVALLRLRRIPAGFCYQLLADGAGGLVVHGLAAMWLEGRWHRLDPRGNKPGVHAAFDLDNERLAFCADPTAGEVDHPTVFPAPVPEVLAPLRRTSDVLTAQLATAIPG